MSEFQREVSSSLGRLGLAHSLEYSTPCGLYSLDIVLSDRPVCIEVDGPHHFTSNRPWRVTATSRARGRLVEAAGWSILRCALSRVPSLSLSSLNDTQL